MVDWDEIRTLGIPDAIASYPDLSRVEVIDHRRPRGTELPARVFMAGRMYGDTPFDVHIAWQDGGRTLKIFLADRPRPEEKA